MICIILVAGHGTLLENEIKNSAEHSHLGGIPKALLPGVGGKRILDYWWQVIKTRQLFSEVYLVTNADKYKHYERWATASDFPVENIINDGTTTYQNRLGAVADFDLVLRTKNVQDDVLVVAGDMLFHDTKFDMAQVVDYFRLKGDGDLALLYEMEPSELTKSRGIAECSAANSSSSASDPNNFPASPLQPTKLNRGIVQVDNNNRITKFFEKPHVSETSSRLASVVFYIFRRQTCSTLSEYLHADPGLEERSFGKYMEWLVNCTQTKVYGMKLPTGFQLIGQVGLSEYEGWLSFFSDQSGHHDMWHQEFKQRAYARVGLMGNPSDGFYGKTIAMSISNFWAEVSIQASKKLSLIPHPLNDPTEFGSLADLHGISRKEGYLGGLRLLQATCKKFYQYCSQKGIALTKRNFTLKYDTNIPRQVGLAGSSAIVTATLKCLMQFFNLKDCDMPKEHQPQFILDVEKQELFIQAGLQDRVIQVYEGLVYMDFSQGLMEGQGHGTYTNMPMVNLPQFWLAFVGDPSDSGKFHSDVAQRWRNGDADAVTGMKKFADLTDQARLAIENQDWEKLADLMNQNFNLRRELYGDAALGASNIKMVEIARHHGSAVKFPGSGGAVIGLCIDQRRLAEMKSAFQSEGFVFVSIIPYSGHDTSS